MPRFHATRCPEVETTLKGQRVWVFDATAIARQFGIRDRLLITPRALAAFVPLRMRTDDHEVMYILNGLQLVLGFDRSATRFAWDSSPDGREPIRLTAEFDCDELSYRYLIDLNQPESD